MQSQLISRRRRKVRLLRWALIAGSLALIVVLLLRKDYVVGLILACLLGLRVLLLLSTSPARGRPGWAPMAGQRSAALYPGRVVARQVLRQMARDEFKVAADAVGIDAVYIRREFGAGQSISDIARAKGVPVDIVVNAVLSDVSEKIDAQVAVGTLSPQQAGVVKAHAPTWVNRFVTVRRQDLDRFKH
jgi:hypothetical protein